MRKSIMMAVSVGIVASGVFVGAGAADAAVSECTKTQVCVWEDYNYDESERGMTQSDTSYADSFWVDWLSGDIESFNDRASSVANYGGSCRVMFYQNKNYGGDWIYFDSKYVDGHWYDDNYLKDGGGVGGLSRDYTHQGWDNRISSHQFVDCK